MVADLVGGIILSCLRVLAYLYSFQPRRLQTWGGFLLGSCLYGLRYRYAVVQQNLEIVYPGQTEKFKRELARDSYTHFGNLVLEILMLLGPFKKFVRKYADVQGYENFKAARDLGKGVIFLSSHVGNWEIMAASGGVVVDTDLMLVTKRIKPGWLHRAIEKGRMHCNVRATYEPRTLKDVLGQLNEGRTVGFVMDQYVGPPVGVRVPFFGVPVGTALVVAAIAKRTGAPVLPVENYRTASGKWIVSIQPPVEWQTHPDPHFELALNTARYTSVVEKSILDHPDQWLWMHRRFKGDLSPLRHQEWNEPRVRR